MVKIKSSLLTLYDLIIIKRFSIAFALNCLHKQASRVGQQKKIFTQTPLKFTCQQVAKLRENGVVNGQRFSARTQPELEFDLRSCKQARKA